MKIFLTIREIYNALEAGKQLANPTTWANRATATAALVAFIQISLLLSGEFLTDQVNLSEGEIQAIAAIVSFIGVFISDRLHTAANKDAGKIK